MKKLFAMFLALTMTFQLITPAWADAAVEAPEEVTEASEVVEEVEEEIPETTEEETTEVPEETLPEETTEATEEETEVTEPALEELPEEEEPIMEEVPEEEVALQTDEDMIDSGTCGTNVNWVLTADGTLTISGRGTMKNYSYTDTAPWYKNRKNIVNAVVESGVAYLGDYAFYGCYKLCSATLKEGVRAVGNYAFYDCKKLMSVILSDNLVCIYGYAFSGCNVLTNITIPENVTKIGERAFENCSSLMSVTIPAGMTSIEYDTFSGCSRLTNVTIPESVTSIASGAFSGCSNLTSVTIPDGVTNIGIDAFSGCSSLICVTIPDGVTYIAQGTFSGCSSLMSVTIPDGVTRIWDGAFSGCSSLISVTIPGGIASIESSTFFGCNSLTSVIIPESVTSIGSSAFYNCCSLTNVIIPESVTSIGSCAFQYCSGLTSVTIPEGVTSIGNEVFYGCRSLTSVTIPNGVTSIGRSVFSGCSSLTSVEIPEGVVNIEYETFSNCNSLASVTIPASTREIGIGVFSDCYNLTSVIIPDGVTELRTRTFLNCSNLTDIYIPQTAISIDFSCFWINHSKLKNIYYGGSDLDWTKIEIDDNNPALDGATIHYNSIHICELVPTPAKAPTCTESGNNTYYTCKLCQKVYQDEQGLQETTVEAETLPALGHSMEKTEAKAATCTEDGNNEYFACATCHKVFKDAQGDRETTAAAEILPALGHAMVRVETTAPTCTGKGNRVYYRCETCGKSFKDKAGLEATTPEAEAVAALGHTMVKTEAVAPTCKVSGSNAYYTCETCHMVFKDAAGKQETTPDAEILVPLGHTMKKTVAKDPTCTEPGNNLYYTCITCCIVFQDDQGEKQTTVESEIIPALGHSMEETPAVVPTCTEGGNNAYFTCETCHKVFKDAEGKQETTVKAETLAALGHHMILTAAVAPSCTESGTNAYYTCATCHKVYKDVDGKTETNVEAEVLAPVGHKMEAVAAKEPTCTETGSNPYYLCANCGKAYLDEQGEKETSVNAETIPALGHTMQETVAVIPTCTEGGNNAYFTCATCHKVYKDAEGEQETGVEAETLAPLGHSMVKTPAVEPTHTTGGNNAYYTCSVCHKVFKDVDGQTETTVEAEQLPRLPGLAHGTSGSLNWFLSEEAVLTVSGAGRMPDYSGNDLAPWYAFRGKIQKVVLEEGVQTVGSYAFFDCNMLTDVELPQSVTKLGKSCFDGCGQLKLLSLEKVPAELTQKVTDLNGLAILAEPISSLVGNRAAYHWSLETVRGENQASDLAKLDGTKLEVIHSGKFYLVCEEDYTGLSAAIEVGAKTATEIRPLETEQLASGESLTLSAWAMPFDTRLSAKWTLDQESEAYASISSDGTLTAKAVTAPVQITVKAQPVNGEAAAEKTLWILPKTTGLGILADGHLAGETLTVDLTETRELTLSAQIQPQGAGTKVTWTSSREDVAVIDETGKVLLLKPGKTLIRAETQDGSGIAAELALTVRYLDSAETLTLTAQIPETGLEPGMTAKLTLSGENAIDAQNVTFYIPENQAAVATIDETGTLTAGTTPGTVTVTAALKDDPLMRQAQLTVTVNPMLNHALRLESDIPEGLGYVDGSTFYGEIAGIAGQNRSFALKVQGQDYLGSWAEAKNVTYASSNPAIAAVDASGTVSLTAKEEGICQITVRCTDALEAEAQLTIVLQNSAPRLGATTVTLNSNSTQGADVDLVASYGNTVDTVTVYDYNKSSKTYALSAMFTAEAEEGTLTLYSQNVLKNGTYPIKLEVACRTGVYTFAMNVKVANTTPKVTVKQTAKLNLFYKNSTAPLAVTAPGQAITDVVLTDTDDFTLMSNGEDWEIVYISENAKPDTKGTLNVYLEGYQEPVKVNLTVGTVTTAPAVKLSAASSTLNTALNSDLTTRVTLLDKAGQPLELENPTVESSNADVSVNGSLLSIALDEAKSTTVTLYLRDSTWAGSVKLTHKLTVSNKLPTLKPAGNLTLNSLFAKGTAETGFILSQSNLTLVNVEATPAAKEGTSALAESEKLNVTYDPVSGHMTASMKDANNAPKAGTYSFNCTGTLEDGTQIPGGTLKVTVSATAPKVKLSAASVKLNKFLAGEEQGSVTVTVPAGYQVADFTWKSEGMTFDEDTGILSVTLENASDNGGSYTLYPVVRDVETGEEVELSTKLSFKVQTYNSQKLSVSLSAKGKLDTQTDSEILYTVTKLTGCLGIVDNVILEGQDANLFRAEMDVVNGKPTVHLTLVNGVTYATNKAYKIQFRFYACGTEILSPVQTVKVTQTALKVTAPKTVTYYQAQKSPLRVVLTSNVPLDEVTLNNKTAKEFQAAVGEVTLNGNRVEFEIANPAVLTAGKSYSVALDATPENNAENAKPVAVRLTVKVQK